MTNLSLPLTWLISAGQRSGRINIALFPSTHTFCRVHLKLTSFRIHLEKRESEKENTWIVNKEMFSLASVCCPQFNGRIPQFSKPTHRRKVSNNVPITVISWSSISDLPLHFCTLFHEKKMFFFGWGISSLTIYPREPLSCSYKGRQNHNKSK